MGSAANQARDWHRATRREPCPECGRPGAGCVAFDNGDVGCFHTTNGEPFPNGAWLGAHRVRRSVHDPAPARPRPQPAAPELPAAAAIAPADVPTRHTVYSALLAACPLSEAHRRYLQEEGLPADQLAGYGTLHAPAAGGLAFPDEVLRTVPGFVRRDGGWAPAVREGLLVAVRDVDDRIVGLQARVVDATGNKRYVWLSSAGAGGPSSCSPAHVAVPTKLLAADVWITEGVKKAHIASLHTRCVTIGLAGHANQGDGLAALEALRDAGARCAIIAFDEDAAEHTRELVAQSRDRLIAACFALGLAVRVARWDGELGKGIDDLFVAGHTPRIEIVVPPAGAGESSGPGDDAAFGREARAIIRSALPDAEKVAALVLAANLGTDERPPRRVWYHQLAEDAGYTKMCNSEEAAAKKFGQAVLNLAERGLVEREVTRDEATGNARVAVALHLSRLPELVEKLPATSRRLREAARKRRCVSCGSPMLVLRCAACGALQEDALEAIAASGEAVPVADAPAPAGAPLFDVGAAPARKFIRGGPAYQKRERDHEYAQYVAAELAEEAEAAAGEATPPKADSAVYKTGEAAYPAPPNGHGRTPKADSAFGPPSPGACDAAAIAARERRRRLEAAYDAAAAWLDAQPAAGP